MNKNIKFLLLLILVGIFAGFSGYLIKKKSIFDKRATIITVKKNIKETLDKYLKDMIE